VNTILMSVIERYQEIGIMKSMGASAWHIFRLIWTETVLLCLCGGILGAIFSLGLAQITESLIRIVLPFSPKGSLIYIDFALIIKSIGIITGIGIVSGIYPSYKAAVIKPIEAIKSSEGEV